MLTVCYLFVKLVRISLVIKSDKYDNLIIKYDKLALMIRFDG